VSSNALIPHQVEEAFLNKLTNSIKKLNTSFFLTTFEENSCSKWLRGKLGVVITAYSEE